MKKFIVRLIILAFAIISFNANAQVVNVTPTDFKSENNQTVMQNSLHKYSVTPGNINNHILWDVKGGSDGKYYDATGADITTSITAADSKISTVFIKWTSAPSATQYVVTSTEISSKECFDDRINTHKINVTIAENNFIGTLTLTGNTSLKGDASEGYCAVTDADGNTAVAFTLSVNGERKSTLNPAMTYSCKFKYNVGTSIDGTTITWDTTELSQTFDAKTDATDSNSEIIVKRVIPTGDGLYYLHVRINELTDGFNTPVKNLASLIEKATLKQLPSTGAITID